MALGDILLGAVALGRSEATMPQKCPGERLWETAARCLHLSLYTEAMSERKPGAGNLGNAHRCTESREIIRCSRCRSTHLELYMQHERTQMYKTEARQGLTVEARWLDKYERGKERVFCGSQGWWRHLLCFFLSCLLHLFIWERCMCHHVSMPPWLKSEDNLKKQVLPSTTVFRDQTQAINLGSKCLSYWAISGTLQDSCHGVSVLPPGCSLSIHLPPPEVTA